MTKQYAVRDEDVATVENAIDALEDLEDVDVDRSRGRPGDGSISTGEALARICEAYTGWSDSKKNHQDAEGIYK